MSNFLAKERFVLEEYFPGLDGKLQVNSFLEKENNSQQYLSIIKQMGGLGLMIPKEYGGVGANALDAIYIQRAIGSRSPSLAVALTMHHFSAASLVAAAEVQPELEKILRKIAEEKLVLASGFAEGIGNRIFSPTVTARAVEGGINVNGSKKPCTLSNEMDILTASVKLPSNELAIIIIPSSTEGITTKDFWNHWVLKGTDTHEVVLNNVFVPEEYIFRAGTEENLSPVIINGMIWFELLAMASYIGGVSALVEQVINSKREQNLEIFFDLLSDLEQSMNSLEAIAYKFINNQSIDSLLVEVHFVRNSIEKRIDKIASQSVKHLGGINFLTSLESSYLLLVSQLLTFHPPSKKDRLELFQQYVFGLEQSREQVTSE